ncbi:hypothetical protein AXX17_AT2G30450 [Arabidopsis thaliana]|uniref:Transmembrane protein n=1 Tax=Arabidopsis thaliana TaxID=3702 RepID=A0A178VTW0_ARATH|nr:hypothetical protein AXX17_AT2G30450 [Arabidopsis thaliana]
MRCDNLTLLQFSLLLSQNAKKKSNKSGAFRESNSGPLAPEARIIPLDQMPCLNGISLDLICGICFTTENPGNDHWKMNLWFTILVAGNTLMVIGLEPFLIDLHLGRWF